MKKMINLFVSVFIGIINLYGQNDPLKDPNVIWVGETVINFNPDLNRQELKNLDFVGYTQSLKKTVSSTALNEFGENNEHLMLAGKILTGKQKKYSDSLLLKEISSSDYKKIAKYKDTIITFDPNTFEKFTTIVENELTVYEIRHYKMR